jgi:hypothetical protein
MKLVMIMILVSVAAMAAPNAPKKNLPVTKEEKMVKKELTKTKELNALDKKPEDCDDKAKKPVEITPESISLSGTTGCSLDEAHP